MALDDFFKEYWLRDDCVCSVTTSLSGICKEVFCSLIFVGSGRFKSFHACMEVGVEMNTTILYLCVIYAHEELHALIDTTFISIFFTCRLRQQANKTWHVLIHVMYNNNKL